MQNKFELIEDISIVADIIFTAIAVLLGNLGNKNLSNLFFGISGFFVTLAFICVIIKYITKNNNKK